MRFYGAEYNNIERGEVEFNIVVLCSIKPHIDLVQVQLLYNIVAVSFIVQRKPEYPEKTINLSQLLYNIVAVSFIVQMKPEYPEKTINLSQLL
jgi:hypothetical protein